ncbi:MAG TPA: hypothetical protein VHL57_07820, partial [Flavobacteriales bacterium]|nr:hypothetical protein [Flavobacteriales bacterium]
GVPVGHWEERDAQGRLVRAYDLLEGGLHGSYLEYHPNGRVKWAGQYGAVTDTVSFEDAVTKKPVPIEMHTQGKVGTWEHRDAQGALLERIAYGEPKQ